MFSSTAKMSVEASDVQTDEDCEELVEDGFSFSADFLEKKTRRRRSSKPPMSPKSPYLSSLNMNPRRAAVVAWRLPRASLGDTRGGTPGEMGSARFTSLSNGHDLSQMIRSECDVTPEVLKQNATARKQHKHLHSASNGFTFGTADCRDKQDMYDEIIRLKKSLQAHKSDNQQMKAKLRRLEEDNARREKQIEELLDPTKGSEYTRSLVDKKKEGSVVLNGLKQRILKLEQQCREKENALSKLQSELRTTNLEELKITVETYFEEIQRLKMLLEAAEKSSRAESKCSQRQQKALSSTVLRLSESLKQLQQENASLREELNTDSPAGGIKGYREWSKQRLLRRLLELEKLEDGRRHAHSRKSSGRLDKEAQTTTTEILDVTQGFTMATEAVVSVGTNTEEVEEVSALSSRLSQLEKEGEELQETLSKKDEEMKRLRTERDKLEEETEQWKVEQTNERDRERQQHKQEMEKLWVRIQTLEEGRDQTAQTEQPSPSPTMSESHEDTEARGGDVEEGKDKSIKEEELKKGQQGEQDLAADAEKRSENRQQKERERAARIIQTNWREHSSRDIVMLQSTLRGHILRESRLKDLLKDKHNKAAEGPTCTDQATEAEGLLDVAAVTMIQSAFRGHLARCGLVVESSELSVPPAVGERLPTPRRLHSTHTPSRTGAAKGHNVLEKQDEEDTPVPVSSTKSRRTPTGETVLRYPTESGAADVDSDDSDDIIVSPSRPPRRREVLLL
ncbi:IQ domain-containing protein E isoform X2 [Sphaeramia orbicularis]|uniref:IQ domain-containing protein E isoform X2 n=1 Tax=Sphaeramia orbicularis TaxID=375764 RepID=UPI0011814E9A|nr:IQ domain-containing protein E isoform X2 [Sphaeramia orbicularis]